MIDTHHKMILSSGRFGRTSRADLTAAFDNFTNSDQKNTLVIHFHGGLVSETAAETAAESLLGTYQEAGGYPFFVIWQTWVTEILRNNWNEIIKEDAFSILVERAVQFLLGKLDHVPGSKGTMVELPPYRSVQKEVKQKQNMGAEPFAERNAQTDKLDEELSDEEREQFESLLQTDSSLSDAAIQLSRPDAPELNPELKAELEKAQAATDPGAKGLISSTALIAAGLRILARCLKRFSRGRDHGLYTTVMEEAFRELRGDAVGGLIWRHIKKDSADAFQDADDQFGGTALLKEIQRIWDAGHRPRIILIGHSAGTVYICNLLVKAAEILPPEIRFDVIFLAPACTFKLLDSALEVAGDRISSFRIYGLTDATERKDAILPPLYLYSLLYFVSGVLDDEVDTPLVGMERFSSPELKFDQASCPEIGRVLQRMANYQTPWVWSGKNAGPGLFSMALRHGDFDNEKETLASLRHWIEQKVL